MNTSTNSDNNNTDNNNTDNNFDDNEIDNISIPDSPIVEISSAELQTDENTIEIELNDTDIENLNENISDENISDENMSEENSSNSENLTSSMLSINNDLNSSTLSINEEENNLLNNYQYSSDTQVNIDTTVEQFIKFTQTYPEFVDLISKTRKNTNALPELMKSIKLYNHRLALNLMDNPGFCFEKIFDILFNKTKNVENHKESINKILEIFPEYSEDEIFSMLKICNYSIDSTIEYLCG
tara:strand:- start:246 stop:968 length:723 start_codon:yes stop_codon:yes gene_type:complete